MEEEDNNGEDFDRNDNYLHPWLRNQIVPVAANDDDDISNSEQELSDTQSCSSSSSPSSQMGAEQSSGAGSGEEQPHSPSARRTRRASGEEQPHRPSARRTRRDKAKKHKINFDRDLPATHSYLGEDLEDAGGGQTVIEPEAVKEGVPLYPVHNLILMPGQTLPLQNLTFRHASMFQQIITHHKLFAVVTIRLKADENGYELANIGTLAQVTEYKEETEADVTSVKAKAVGRQRFELLEKQRLIDGSQVCKVRILPEYSLLNPLKCFELPSMAKFKIVPLSKKQTRGPSRFKEEIVDQVIFELSVWYDEDKIRRMAENKPEFSYWVASNLPIDDYEKLQLLSINCTLQRLKWELTLLKQCTVLCCQRCEQVFGDKADIFSMSVDGPMGAYVNPGGVIHEMFTLLSVQGVSVVTRPETVNSWFPGYVRNHP